MRCRVPLSSQGIELGFLLASEFIADPRRYAAKRQRVERVCLDITTQCKLITEVIDAELEEEGTAASRLSLTQDFPFEGCPPVTSEPCPSPGLTRLVAAVRAQALTATTAEKNSLIKVWGSGGGPRLGFVLSAEAGPPHWLSLISDPRTAPDPRSSSST